MGTGYSANVQLCLQVNGQAIKLAHIGPEMVIFDQPVDLPPCEAEIAMDVDDRTRCWTGTLPE